MSSASTSTSSSSSSASASAPLADSESLKAALSKLPAKWHPSLDASNPIPTLYWFPFSQPSRATAQLLAEGNIAHKKIEIDINSKMEQKDPLYMEFINPAGLVPALFKPAEGRWMAESNDIMKYLISIYPDRLSSFYPTQSDVSACEFIESQLKFISETVRPIATGLIRAIAGSKDKAEVLKKMEETPALVRQIEQHFQEAKQHFPALEASASASSPAVTQSASVVYFAGTDHPTIADLQLFHEIVATKDIGFFPWDAKTAPLLDRWYKTMANRPATKKTYAPIKNIAAILRVVLNVKRCFGGVTL